MGKELFSETAHDLIPLISYLLIGLKVLFRLMK